MELINKGKTKDVYRIDDKTVRLLFKDDVTGADGVFDPGANDVGLQIEGIGNLGLRLTTFFFEKLSDIVPTHFIASDISNNTMDVKLCKPFGNGLEVICRLQAAGSFIRRYGAYIKEYTPLDYLVEFTLKDDQRQDPLITEDSLIALKILDQKQYDVLEKYTVAITQALKSCLSDLDLELIDIKYEYGIADGGIVLMDEISAGSMRVSQDGKILDPITLSNIILKAHNL